MPVDMRWQVQEAKQRFSELLRRAESDGPQYVSRHGHDVVVVLTVREFEQLRHKPRDLSDVLLGAPRLLTDDDRSLFDRSHEVVSRRETPFVDS